LAIRHFVYWSFVENSKPPSVAEAAAAFAMAPVQMEAAYRRLHQHHFFFLQPGTSDILMANPLSAVPTLFHVHTERHTYWANCAWDMLGIPAMLNEDASIEAVYTGSQAKADFAVTGGQFQHEGGLVHFAVPFAHWYDDLVFT
jgi:hypothetical protein